MSDVNTDNESVVSEVPETPKKTSKGCSRNAPKGNSVEAGKGKSTRACQTFMAEEGNLFFSLSTGSAFPLNFTRTVQFWSKNFKLGFYCFLVHNLRMAHCLCIK